MSGRIFYIRMSILLTAAVALSACSGGGGNSTNPNQKDPLNKGLNLKSSTNTPNQSAFPSGGQFTINNPPAANVVQKQNLQQQPQDPPSTNSNADGTEKVVGPAPAKSGASQAPAQTSTAGGAQATQQSSVTVRKTSQATAVTTHWAPPKPSFTKLPSAASVSAAVQRPSITANPTMQKVAVNAGVYPLVPSFSKLPAGSASQTTSSITVTMHDQNNNREVLRQIPTQTKSSSVKTTTPAKSSASTVARRTTARKSKHSKTRVTAVAMDDGGTADPALVQRLNALDVQVTSVPLLKRNQVDALYNTSLDVGQLNVNTNAGAVVTTDAHYGVNLSEYGGFIPRGVYYLVSASPNNSYQSNSACDVTVNIGSAEYHNAPCIVFQKDSIDGTVRETAYNLYVQRRADNSASRIVRVNDSNLSDDMPYIQQFLSGMQDGIYIVSFETNLPGQE